MKNKKFVIILALLPIISFADIDDIKEERMKILSDLGLPLPGSGIKLVHRSTLGLSEEQMEKGLSDKKQMEEKGFIEENTTRPTELLNFRSHANLQFKQFEGNNRNSSTHLRRSSDELKLGFKFKPLTNEFSSSTIGFSPQGGFHQDTGGWSGVVQFFENKEIGVCAYAERNVEASQTAAELALEDVVYEINNKPTLKYVKGNAKLGFVYDVEWFDNENFHELECANMNYRKKIDISVVELAKKIDNR